MNEHKVEDGSMQSQSMNNCERWVKDRMRSYLRIGYFVSLTIKVGWERGFELLGLVRERRRGRDPSSIQVELWLGASLKDAQHISAFESISMCASFEKEYKILNLLKLKGQNRFFFSSFTFSSLIDLQRWHFSIINTSSLVMEKGPRQNLNSSYYVIISESSQKEESFTRTDLIRKSHQREVVIR